MSTSTVRKSALVCAVFLLMLAGLAGCGSESDDETAAAASGPVVKSVVIENSTYKPATTEISLGDEIKFTNRDEVPHYAISRIPQVFETMPMREGESYTVEPNKRGTFVYFCSLEPKMKGRVIVN